jgi:hypothetical protein
VPVVGRRVVSRTGTVGVGDELLTVHSSEQKLWWSARDHTFQNSLRTGMLLTRLMTVCSDGPASGHHMDTWMGCHTAPQKYVQ